MYVEDLAAREIESARDHRRPGALKTLSPP
jgi:hypothetical protein